LYAFKKAGRYSLTKEIENPAVSKPKSRKPVPEKKEKSLTFMPLMDALV
jgi:hypothetical protein